MQPWLVVCPMGSQLQPVAIIAVLIAVLIAVMVSELGMLRRRLPLLVLIELLINFEPPYQICLYLQIHELLYCHLLFVDSYH